MSREAMQLALEALEDYVEEYGPHEKDSGAAYVITALRQALETEQEPVAFINVEEQKLEWAKRTLWHTPTVVKLPKIPLYTAPPKREWVGLTDEEKEKLVEAFYGTDIQRLEAIEAKLKEKNT